MIRNISTHLFLFKERMGGAFWFNCILHEGNQNFFKLQYIIMLRLLNVLFSYEHCSI